MPLQPVNKAHHLDEAFLAQIPQGVLGDYHAALQAAVLSLVVVVALGILSLLFYHREQVAQILLRKLPIFHQVAHQQRCFA